MSRKKSETALAIPEPDPRARETDRRVWRIASMMTSGAWDRKDTAAQLAAEWNLSESAVRNMSAEAGRMLRLVREPEAAVEHVLARLHELMSHPLEPLETIAAARAILDGYKSFGYKGGAPEVSATPPAQAQESLEAELRNPGPELADALERTGWRRVVETTGEET